MHSFQALFNNNSTHNSRQHHEHYDQQYPYKEHIVLTVDEIQADHADQYAGDFTGRQRFMIQKTADDQQCRGKKGALHDGGGTDLPASLVCVYEPYFEPYDDDTEHKRGPVQVRVFPEQMAVSV